VTSDKDANLVTYALRTSRLSLQFAIDGSDTVSYNLLLDHRSVPEDHLIASKHMPAQTCFLQDMQAAVGGYTHLSPCWGLPPSGHDVMLKMADWKDQSCPAVLKVSHGKPPETVCMRQAPVLSLR